jgi:ABC-type Fe3+ transport system substrate-binding protein
MFPKIHVKIALSLLLTLGIVLAAYAAPVPPSPTTPPRAPTPKPVPTPTALDSIIEGAKKEGAVYLLMDAAYGLPGMWDRAQKEISTKFGVDLQINFTATKSFPATTSLLLTEKKAGKAPDYDLVVMSLTNSLPLIEQGSIITKVDWKSLVTKDTNPEVLLTYKNEVFPIVKTKGEGGYIYNPTKVEKDKLPKSLSDLADPIWKGKVGIFDYPGPVARIVMTAAEQVGGIEKAKDVLRAVIRNRAFVGGAVSVMDRFLIGEIVIGVVADYSLPQAEAKGVPAGYQIMRKHDISEDFVIIPMGCKNPNAAKLLVIYLASPAGAKCTYDTCQQGTYHYPGNCMYDLVQKAKKEGLRIDFLWRSEDALKNMVSREYEQLQKDVIPILGGH